VNGSWKKVMAKEELRKLKAALERKQAELKRSIGKRDDIAIEKAPDAIDEVQLACEREFAIRTLDRESQLLRQVRAALARVEDGSYGVCQRCEEVIGSRRLDALPWAAYCVRCQETVDRERAEGDSPLELEDVA
jgi:RNA polymerase-binding transcription factor